MTTHKWFWDGATHVDPQKEAAATSERLTNLTTTLADEFAKQGKAGKRNFGRLLLKGNYSKNLASAEQ